MITYSVYEKISGKLLCKGDAYECAKVLGVKPHEMYRIGKSGNSKLYDVVSDTSDFCVNRDVKKTIYAVYDRQDNILCVGNAMECTKALGFSSVNCFYSCVSRSNRGKRQKYFIIKGRMEEQEE